MAPLSTMAKLVAAVMITAAATLALPSAPAQAASCSAEQVSVVVDYGALGGGTAAGCGTGSTADKAFTSAGVSLGRLTGQPGVVCKVNGKPSQGSCFTTTSYWGFFVDNGKGWVYASQGVYSQAVGAGDSVALAWQCSGTPRKPGQTGSCSTPTRSASTAPKPKPSNTRTPRPSKAPATRATSSVAPKGPTTPSASATTTAPSASPSRKPGPKSSPSPASSSAIAVATTSADPTPSASMSPTTEAAITPASSESSGGMPGWVPPVLIAVLAAAAGGIAWARRAR